MNYYILQDDETKGPYTIGQLRSMWNSGAITGQTFYCQEGYSKWFPLIQLQSKLETLPQPLITDHKVQTIEATSKKWKAIQLASVLAIIIGVLVIIAAGTTSSFGAMGIGALIFVGGLLAFLFARVGAWWHHG